MSSFHVDGRVSIKLEYDLAMRLGEFILSSGTEDKQFIALGHKLLNLDEDENAPSKFSKNREYFHEKEIIRATGRVLNDANSMTDMESPEEGVWENKTPIRVRSKYSKNY